MKMMYNRVLILPDDHGEEFSDGGVIMPNPQDKPKKGTIIDIGPKLIDREPPKIGDKVLYRRTAEHNEIRIEGVRHWIMREPDLIAVIL